MFKDWNGMSEEKRGILRALATGKVVSIDEGFSDISRNREKYREAEAEGIVTVDDNHYSAPGGILPPPKEPGLHILPTELGKQMVMHYPELRIWREV